MFSNDSNIETIAQLVEELKKFATLKGRYLRLDFAEKMVRLLTVLIMAFILTILLLLIMTCLSFCAVFALEPHVGVIKAFAIVGGAYFLLLILCFLFRKSWIQKPLVRFLANLLMS